MLRTLGRIGLVHVVIAAIVRLLLAFTWHFGEVILGLGIQVGVTMVINLTRRAVKVIAIICTLL